MTDRDIPHPNDNWVIETKQLSSRVMTVRTLVDGKRHRLVARVCNYSDEPYELKRDSFLARAEPVECLPGPGEELPQESHINRRNNMLSMATGASEKTELLL